MDFDQVLIYRDSIVIRVSRNFKHFTDNSASTIYTYTGITNIKCMESGAIT